MRFAERGLTDLQSYVAHLEERDQLLRVRSEVDANQELAGVAKRLEGTKPVLFERVKGARYPVLMGLYWNRGIMAALFETSSQQLPFALAAQIQAWRREPMPPEVLERGPANEVVEQTPDLDTLPIPKHAEGDGGPYLTSSVVIAKDPDTGVRNLSIHRMMKTGPRRFTLLLEELGHVMDYYKRAEAKGQPLEVTINNGVDFAVTMAGAAPSPAAPIDMDELGIASQIRGRPVPLVKSQTVEVEGIADAQFIIEGRILPGVREPEGPYAEVTGYYATREPRWVLEVTAITRRDQPIFHSILSGKEVYNAFACIAEAGIYDRVKAAVPDVTAVHLSDGSVPYHLVIQMNKRFEGSQRNAIMAGFLAQAFIKMVTVVDTDVDIFDSHDVEWAIATRARFESDLLLVPESTGHRLNPSVVGDKWTRLGIDATVPLPREPVFERATMREVDLADYDIDGL